MNFKREFGWIAIVVAAAIIVFLNTLGGEFVYDDQRQIAINPLIQESARYWEALTSDVWAFKGDGSLAASNYWRPVFTAWCIVNFRFFGLDPMGWHLLNILLHSGVCVLAFLLLRRWGIVPAVATAIALVFAVHPVHTESVAWISGSPDLLSAFFILLSLLFADRVADQQAGKTRTRDLVLSVGFYMLALGSKEIALFCAPIFVLILSPNRSDQGFRSAIMDPAAWRRAAPYFIAAVGYFVLRLTILGRVSLPAENAPDSVSAILTAPSVFVFYVSQIVFPFELGPNYSLRPVDVTGVYNFFLPLVISALLLAGVVFAVRGSFVRRMGAALFALPLLPAFVITTFPSDQIVHDRYLYLSLLGFLIIVGSFIADLIKKRFPDSADYILIGAVPLIGILALQTYNYNKVWNSDIALWRHAVSVDRTSASNWLQLGAELAELNDLDAAGVAYQRSIEIRPDPLAIMGNSRIAIARGDSYTAIRDLEAAISLPAEKLNAYTLFQIYESLAVALQQEKRYPEAERRLREARDRLPIYRAALTEKLAVILYLQNRKPDALAELESVRTQAGKEMLMASKSVFLRLGMLYAEQGRSAEARAALQEFLSATGNATDRPTLNDRRTASELIQKLR